MWEGWARELADTGAADLGRPAGPWPDRRLAARRIHGRGLCRFHRGAGRRAQSRPLRAGRPFAGRRRGLDLRRDPARPGEPADPGRLPRAIRATTARCPGRPGSRACRWSATSASTSSPSALVRRSLAEIYADPAMVTPERVRRYRRAAALSRQPRGHAAARAHPGAARSDAAQAARRADPDPVGRPRTAGCRRPTPSASRTTSRAPSSRSSRSWATTRWKRTPRPPPPRSPPS